MDKFYNESLCKLETAIKDLETGTDCSIERVETIINIILKCLSELKECLVLK